MRGRLSSLYYDYYQGYYDKDKSIREYFEEIDYNLIPFLEKRNLCIPKDNLFQNCESVEYDENTNKYVCSKCYSGFYFDTDSNICKYTGSESECCRRSGGIS